MLLGVVIAKLCHQNTKQLLRQYHQIKILSSQRLMLQLMKFQELTSKDSQLLNSILVMLNKVHLLISKAKEKKKASSNGLKKKLLILGLKLKKLKKTSD